MSSVCSPGDIRPLCSCYLMRRPLYVGICVIWTTVVVTDYCSLSLSLVDCSRVSCRVLFADLPLESHAMCAGGSSQLCLMSLSSTVSMSAIACILLTLPCTYISTLSSLNSLTHAPPRSPVSTTIDSQTHRTQELPPPPPPPPHTACE